MLLGKKLLKPIFFTIEASLKNGKKEGKFIKFWKNIPKLKKKLKFTIEGLLTFLRTFQY